jgi:CheY-like chemotaxis protein/tetratricopeptide (TPR) repeat protein
LPVADGIGTGVEDSLQDGAPVLSIWPADFEGIRVAGTVLCIDDDRNLCQIIARALGEEGYEVLTAYDGEEALEVFDEAAPDLVLVDLILPRRDGFAVLEAIRGRSGPLAATRVVVISGCSPTPEYRDRAAALDVTEFLTKPVPLDTLLEVVKNALVESKPGVPVAGAAPGVDRRRERGALHGNLGRLPFPALLHHLHGLRASGVLHLESGKKRKWIEFRDGQPSAVRSNLVNECLGHYLLRTGRIKHAELEESLRRMKSGEGELQGEILVAMDILSEEEITAALHAQADEKLFEIFEWEVGDFRFDKGSKLERANSIGIKRSPANLILRGVRERFSGRRIAEFLHSHADCVVAAGNSPYYRFQEVDLGPEHEAVLEQLDGRRRVSAILAEDVDERLARTLYALVSTGLLTLRGGSVRGSQLEEVETATPRRAVERRADASEPDCARLQEMAVRFQSQNFFEILGVAPDAAADEVERAYERLAESVHPDRFKGASEAVRSVAEEVFDHVSRARATLADSRRRGEYVLEQRREEREASRAEAGRRALAAAEQFRRGEALLRGRAYEEALVCFGSALENNPEEGDYHAHYGWTLHLTHPTDTPILKEAIEHLRRSLKLASHPDQAYLFMGRIFRSMGQPEQAEKMFTRAVQIEPDCVEALRELRLINMRRERSKGLIKRLLRR